MTGKADKQVWFITGAGRGMGVDFVKAALAGTAGFEPATPLKPQTL